MKPETDNEDHQPFLGFRDDPNKRHSADDEEEQGVAGGHALLHQQHALKTSRTRRWLRDFLVFLATSLVWVLAFSFIPGPQQQAPSTPSPGTAAMMPTPPSMSGLPLPLPQVGQDGKAGTIPDPKYLAATHNMTSEAKLVMCGNSTAEAKKAGCKYDTLLNHWVPEQCYDKEFETEYMDDDTWHAYSDVNLTKRLTREEMGDQESYYTSIADHVNHCSMLWKKQFWTMFEERRVFDGVIVNSYHTEHCADFLKDIWGSNRTEPTFVRVAFSGCWVRK
ncbi:hypothetical protein CGCF415_v012911 [Colletotrichum fructicola]|uniref:Uncharacterized protein n=1 Tax=Colletotrichum fructicola (strain Nara gc5) TaxID=1213859 RepID=A0A7J6JQH7_COLFN|nr:uncharacterized protein CGMCC3_g10561 [Colletotrichum fructicola]KAF4492994.1 hypothetical protein CGGC5_v000961 [Colletotrichum fructicola Nara gc5]KAE9573309.1 hypothetical protein CGMCC3_g10561 [Colletotrichum fructicola]KAF4427250.1 hypothetical protein CFRS1_v003284 [Colletotrichum fructicola]KAF4885751.1 hypothetical protein CGCFRS4_v011719 [Colletotrichum fructicola]KAF4892775.1 hypothetical protein CGCF415_v012911 [Colletotrichum fructicola]